MFQNILKPYCPYGLVYLKLYTSVIPSSLTLTLASLDEITAKGPL